MSAHGLRVALLTPCFWPEVRRGAERFTHELARGLLERHHGPRIITSHPGRPRRGVEDGIPITRNWRPPDARLRRRYFEDHLTHVPLSYLALRGGDYDVAQAMFPSDGLAAARWSRRTGRPSVLAYMGLPDRMGLVARRGRIEITMRAARECTAVTALSRTAAEAFSRWLGVEARVIPPGVDVATFTPGEPRAEAPTIFCPASAAEPAKQINVLIDAFRRVRSQRSSARLVLSRPRDPDLAWKLADASPGIELRDVDDRSALVAAYREAWTTALPSFGEAFGLVLVESLACGTPVVGSDAGAIPEVVDRPGIGRLFPAGDAEALAGALLDTLEAGHGRATVAACRARAEEFSTDRCVEAHLALYRELLAGAEGARAPSRASSA